MILNYNIIVISIKSFNIIKKMILNYNIISISIKYFNLLREWYLIIMLLRDQ